MSSSTEGVAPALGPVQTELPLTLRRPIERSSQTSSFDGRDEYQPRSGLVCPVHHILEKAAESRLKLDRSEGATVGLRELPT